MDNTVRVQVSFCAPVKNKSDQNWSLFLYLFVSALSITHLQKLSDTLDEISEDFFALTQQPALPFGEIIPTALPSGTSDVGTLVYNNQLGFQADMSSVGRGHCIAVVGLDMYPQPQ